MFLKRFFEPQLAQASYLIGCAAARQAIVIDPNRDVEPYIAAAAAEGATITHVTETHIHADFVSGSRELAARTGATIHVSDEGDAAWKYGFAHESNVRPARHGDRIDVGRVAVDVLHTPGHTPEHLAFLVTDREVAEEPIGAATGDFLFVGDVGRPDLLERAVHVKGAMEVGAHALYRSLQTFASRPDWLQIWPGHGAGSACGKGISAVPHSTLGYERRFNWAFQAADEAAFIASVLSGQPDPPAYFATMKRINQEGPRVLGEFARPPQHEASSLAERLAAGAFVVDTRKSDEFAIGHVPGTINIPFNGSFTTWAGWLMPYTTDVFVIASSATQVDTMTRALALIGLDRVAGWFDATAIDAWSAAGRSLGSIPRMGVDDLAESMRHRGVTLVDVRYDNEWTGVGHIPGAQHIPLGHLAARVAEIPRTKPIAVQCQSGSRSAIAASILRAHGFDQVINFTPGIAGWMRAGQHIERS